MDAMPDEHAHEHEHEHEDEDVTMPVSPPADSPSERAAKKTDKPKPAPNIPTVEHAYNIIFDSWITPPPKPEAATNEDGMRAVIQQGLRQDPSNVQRAFDGLSTVLHTACGSRETSFRQALSRMRDGIYGPLPGVSGLDFTKPDEARQKIGETIPTWEEYAKAAGVTPEVIEAYNKYKDDNTVVPDPMTVPSVGDLKKIEDEFIKWRNAIIEQRLHLYAVGMAQVRAEVEEEAIWQKRLERLDTEERLKAIADRGECDDEYLVGLHRIELQYGRDAMIAQIKETAQPVTGVEGLYVRLNKAGERVFIFSEITPSSIDAVIDANSDKTTIEWTNVPKDKREEVERRCLAAGKRVFFDGEETRLSQLMHPQQSGQSQRSLEDFTGCIKRLREYDDSRTSGFCGWIRSAWRTSKLKKFLTDVVGNDPARLRKFWSDLSQHATPEERAAVVKAMSEEQKAALQAEEIRGLNEISTSLEEARARLKTLEGLVDPKPSTYAQDVEAARAKIAQLEVECANACDEAMAFAEADPLNAEKFWSAFRASPTTPAAIAEVEKRYNLQLDNIETELNLERAKIQTAQDAIARGSLSSSQAETHTIAIREANDRILKLEARRADKQKAMLRFVGNDKDLLQKFWAKYMPVLPEGANVEQRQKFASECTVVRSLLSPKQNEVLQEEEIRRLDEVSEQLTEARTALKELREGDPALLETDLQIINAQAKVTQLEREVASARHEAISFVESNPVIDRKAFLRVAGNDPEILSRYLNRCMPPPLPETATKKQRLAYAQECRAVTELLSGDQRRILQNRLTEVLPNLVKQLRDINSEIGPLKLARQAFKTELETALANTSPVPSDQLQTYLNKQKELVTARETLEKHENELRVVEEQLAQAKAKVPREEDYIARVEKLKVTIERDIAADRERIAGLEREVTAAKEAIKKPLQDQLARDQERLRLAEEELEGIKNRLAEEQRKPEADRDPVLIKELNKEKDYAQRGVEIARERVAAAQKKVNDNDSPEGCIVNAIERSGNSLYKQEAERRKIMGALATAEREASIIGGTTNMPPGMMKAFTIALRSQDVGGGGSLAIIQGGARSTADILFPDSAEKRRLADEEHHRLTATSVKHD